MERITSIEGEKKGHQMIKTELESVLNNKTGEYETILEEIPHLKKQMIEQINSLQQQIDNVLARIKDIDNTEKNITGMTGLSGNTLINCLSSVKNFAESLKKGTTVYSPLFKILEGKK